MILETFTKEELITTLNKAVAILRDRADNYIAKNLREFHKKEKHQVHYKMLSGVIDHQRYYYMAPYVRIKDGVDVGRGPIVTVITVGRRNLILFYADYADPKSTDGSYLKIATEHFLTRYCERNGYSVETMSLMDKVNIWDNTGMGRYTAISVGDIMKQYGNTQLGANFLDCSDFKLSYAANQKGDIAIIEQYGTIPVWRTFVPADMLFDTQVNNPYYQAIYEMAANDVKDPIAYVKARIYQALEAKEY